MNTITRLCIVSPSEDTYADEFYQREEDITCRVASVKLHGESCGAAHGSGAPGCPKSTLAILVLSQSRWCHHSVALVSETSCNSPLANRSKLHDVSIGHRSPDHHGQPENSIYALRKNINSSTMPTRDVCYIIFEKCCYTWLRTLISHVLWT